jgi:hypothetical protein
MKTKTKKERSRGCNFWDENNNPQKKKHLGFETFG